MRIQELLTPPNNVRDNIERGLVYVTSIDADYRCGLLEAHITGALRK